MSTLKVPKHFPQVSVKRGTDGLGLFAMESIKKGAYVIEYVGEVITPEEGDKRENRYIFGVNERVDIDGSARWNLARYINHSCRPNCDAEDINDRVFIIARKNIMLGEEITYDYGKEYFDEWIKPKGCRCTKCRGKTHQRRGYADIGLPHGHHAAIRPAQHLERISRSA